MFYEKIDLYEYAKLPRTHEGGYLTVYARTRNPENTPKTRPALLLIPGGGYHMVSFREGEPIALRFLAAGYAVFLLEYTVQTAHPVPFNEAAIAMQYIRENAARYGVDPTHVCAMGFSAGGHLTGLLATSHADNRPEVRPDAVIFGYPVVTLDGPFTHDGTSDFCTGSDSSRRAALSIQNRVTAESAPAFIWHTMEDTLVPIENSLMLAASYREHGVPFEMHIFEKGWHGLSTADIEVFDGAYPAEIAETVPQWVTLAMKWLKVRGFEVK